MANVDAFDAAQPRSGRAGNRGEVTVRWKQLVIRTAVASIICYALLQPMLSVQSWAAPFRYLSPFPLMLLVNWPLMSSLLVGISSPPWGYAYAGFVVTGLSWVLLWNRVARPLNPRH